MTFTGVKTMWAFHEALQKGLDLPDYYGKNFDALWDCLTSDVILPFKVILKGFNDRIGKGAYVNKIIRIGSPELSMGTVTYGDRTLDLIMPGDPIP